MVDRNPPTFLVVGHPRGATGYMAALFQHYGYDVGHELMGKNGISAWQYAVQGVPTKYNPPRNYSATAFDYIVHVVRNPWDTFVSCAFTEDSLHLREPHLFAKGLERAEVELLSIPRWHRLCDSCAPHLTVKAESAASRLPLWLENLGLRRPTVGYPPAMTENTRPHESRERERYEFDRSIWEEFEEAVSMWEELPS